MNAQKLHRSSPLFVMLAIVLNNLLPFVFSIYIQFREVNVNQWVFWGSLLLLLGTVIGSFWYVHFYRYSIEDTQIVIKSGAFFKQHRAVPLANLHNVAIKQNLLHRLFGVAEVQLESAGSTQSSEAYLRVVSLEEAKRFEALMHRRKVAPTEANIQSALSPENLLPLSRKDLILYGLIRNDGFVWWLVILPFLPEDWVLAWLMKIGFGQWQLAALWLILLALIVGKISTVVSAFITYSNFRLYDTPTHITLECGLFTKLQYHIPREKIQAWRVVQNPFHQLLGYHSLKIDTAMQAGQQAQNGRLMLRELVPLADATTLSALFTRWNVAHIHESRWHAPHPEMPSRLIKRDSFVLACALLLVGVFHNWLEDKALWLLGAMVLIWAVSVGLRPYQYRALRWQIDGLGVMHVRSGVWWRHHVMLPLAHVHGRASIQSALDKRYQMAHVVFDSMSAKPPVWLAYLPEKTARQLVMTEK